MKQVFLIIQVEFRMCVVFHKRNI
uniref:Uncharacterized protein n=1 Tax=Arundo donax TaxID=35708 RepID=A0A0A9HKH8_ARUDO